MGCGVEREREKGRERGGGSRFVRWDAGFRAQGQNPLAAGEGVAARGWRAANPNPPSGFARTWRCSQEETGCVCRHRALSIDPKAVTRLHLSFYCP